MKSLETVHRHGNHNYFKSTFMWYHTDVNGRILPLPPQSQPNMRSGFWQPHSLQFCTTQAVVASKMDYFNDPRVGPLIKDYITEHYNKFNVCGRCNTAKLLCQPGVLYLFIIVDTVPFLLAFHLQQIFIATIIVIITMTFLAVSFILSSFVALRSYLLLSEY